MLFGVLLFALLWGEAKQAPLSSTQKVLAQVGDYRLNLSGFASPFASIILTIDGVFYRSAVADKDGRFSITDVLIKKGFDGFCLLHVDFKRLGESEACITVPPATGSVTKNDIFLPPTLGLQRAEIEAGSDAVAFGYTMPGATVTIHLGEGKSFTVIADANGYYEYTLEAVPAGEYQLFATAEYKGKPSEAPSRTVKLTALSLWDQLINFIRKLWNDFVDRLTGLGLGPLWLIFPLVPIITYLILRLWPERFTFIYDSKLYALMKPREKKLHHAWFVGY